MDWTRQNVERAVKAVQQEGTLKRAAATLHISEDSLRNGLKRAGVDYKPLLLRAAQVAVPIEERRLRETVSALKSELTRAQRETLTEDTVRREIIGLAVAAEAVKPPAWLLKAGSAHARTPGVPTLFASDWHWGEVVDPEQVGGVNAYNLEIAHRRARALINNTVDLLMNHMVNPRYPGIVFALGGDMFSGDIHEELSETNELDIMPTMLDLYGVLVWCIGVLADRFGKVFVPAVTGNHARNSKKPRAKGRAFTNFDWLLYQFLAKKFEGDERVKFLIPSGPDALYSVYDHRYLLTHGDQWRGGDGVIGPIGPIFRGDQKKRARNAQYGAEYDTLLCGHWHTQMQLSRLIVAGSLKGVDEYSYGGNFSYEIPQQPLWVTHKDRGITFHVPVFVDEKRETGAADWVSWSTK